MHTLENKILFPSEVSNPALAVDKVIIYAWERSASDVHIDPLLDSINVRLRIMGVLEEVGKLPRSYLDEIIARLKILSGTRTDVHAVPQDGAWRSHIPDIKCNFRISFMPTYFGENAVIRILPDSKKEEVSLCKLGFSIEHVKLIDQALKKTNGLILVTGPTGSGKTTTLRSCLSEKTRDPISIITLEDPVEYEIPKVRQVHINHAFGVSFGSGLRSALRQDPDVIMVGEIRDNETAKVCVHTALTGHLVLSTLHTNSALESITRLQDMGVERYLIASTLKLIIAQRLVRTICHECDGIGCKSCGKGYIGRTVISEVCLIDNVLSSLINNGSSLDKLTDYALSSGFVGMWDDGMEKVEWGITSKSEVVRVLDS